MRNLDFGAVMPWSASRTKKIGACRSTGFLPLGDQVEVTMKSGFPVTALILIALAGVRVSSAAVTSCGASPGTALSTLQGAGANGNNPANGCGAINMGFSNFAVPASGSDTPPPTAGTIEIQASGTAPVSNAINPITDTFTSIGSGTTGWGILTALNTHTQITDLNYKVSTNLDPAFAPTGGKVWAVNGATALSLTNPVIDITAGTDTIPVNTEILITETLCLGASTAAGCNANDTVQVSVKYTNNGGTNNGTSITTLSASCLASVGFGCVANNGAGTLAFNGVLGLFVEDVVTLQNPTTLPNNADRYSISLSSFSDGFDQTAIAPEPASLGLMGLALASLAVIGYRKRR